MNNVLWFNSNLEDDPPQLSEAEALQIPPPPPSLPPTEKGVEGGDISVYMGRLMTPLLLKINAAIEMNFPGTFLWSPYPGQYNLVTPKALKTSFG